MNGYGFSSGKQHGALHFRACVGLRVRIFVYEVLTVFVQTMNRRNMGVAGGSGTPTNLSAILAYPY